MKKQPVFETEVERLRYEISQWRELTELHMKLLVCYRVGKAPGNWLDKIKPLKQVLGIDDPA